MTMTPESRPEPTAAQLIAIALGTAPSGAAEPVSSEAADGVPAESVPTAPPSSPA